MCLSHQLSNSHWNKIPHEFQKYRKPLGARTTVVKSTVADIWPSTITGLDWWAGLVDWTGGLADHFLNFVAQSFFPPGVF